MHQPPEKLTDALPLQRIEAYLNGQVVSPYGNKRKPYLQTRQPKL
jgi:hypothetical protein